MYIQAWAVAYLYLGALPEPVLQNEPKSSHAFATKINLPFWELGQPKMYTYGIITRLCELGYAAKNMPRLNWLISNCKTVCKIKVKMNR